MSELTAKEQKLIDWIDGIAESLLVRGPMYGDFSEQEATIHLLKLFKMEILETPGRDEKPYEDKRVTFAKYKLSSVMCAADQVADRGWTQEQFSALLKDYWEI